MSHHRCCCGGGSCQCLGRCKFDDQWEGQLFISSNITLGGSRTGRSCPNDQGCRPTCQLSPFGVTSISRTLNNLSLGCGNRCFAHTVSSAPITNKVCESTDSRTSQVNGTLTWCFGEGAMGHSEVVPVGVELGTAGGFAIYVAVVIGTATIDYPVNRFELDQPTLLDNTSKQCSPGSSFGGDRVINTVWGMRSLVNTTWAAGYIANLSGLGPDLDLIDDWGGNGNGGWFGSCGSELCSVGFSAFVHAHAGDGCPLDIDAEANGLAEYSAGGIVVCGPQPDPPPGTQDLPRRLNNHLWKPGDPLPSGLPTSLYRARRTIAAGVAAEDLL